MSLFNLDVVAVEALLAVSDEALSLDEFNSITRLKQHLTFNHLSITRERERAMRRCMSDGVRLYESSNWGIRLLSLCN